MTILLLISTAEHQGQDAMIGFDGRIIEGEIVSGTARRLIRQWALLHQNELEVNWKRATKLQPLRSIAPLE